MQFRTGQESLAEIFGSLARSSKVPSGDLFATTLANAARTHATFRISNKDPQLPFVVLPAEDDLDDLFANVATYYSSRSPLTAFVHVLGKDLAGLFDPTVPDVEPKRGGARGRSEMALLGACLGETALASLNSVEGALMPSYSACKRSLSFTIARTVALYPSFNVNVAVDRWVRLRQLTGLAVSQAALRAVRSVHAATAKKPMHGDTGLIAPLSVRLVEFLGSLNESDAISHVLFECYPGLQSPAAGLEGPFDLRMSAFLATVEGIQRSTCGVDMDSLAVGYFCNRIQPGSFAHVKVLARLIEFFPNAFVWYGMFCSTSANFDFSQFGNGILAKLDRDVVRSFSFAERPCCDLSLDELEILMRASVRSDSVKPTQQKIATIALLPGLDVFSRFTPEDEMAGVKELETARNFSGDERVSRAARLLEEAAGLLQESLHVQSRASSSTSGSSRRQRKR